MAIKKLKEYKNKIKSDGFWNTLFKNSFWAFAGDASASLIGLIITILLIRITGSSNYGILILAQTYMNIIDVSLNVQSWKSVIQYGQKSLTNNKIDDLCSYIKLGTILDVSTAILGCIAAILIAPIIGKLLGWSKILIICAQIFSIEIISHFSGTPTAMLRILNKFNLVALQKFITAIIKLTSIIMILILNKNLPLIYVTIIYCLTDIIGNILLIVFAFYTFKKKYSNTKIFKSKMPTDSKLFINFTLWVTLSEIVDIPVNYFDMFIISVLGNDKVAIFKVFKQCVAILQKVASPIQQAILPQFSELSAKNEKNRGYRIVIKIRNAMLNTITPISLIIGITSPLWLNILYGQEYACYWYVLLIYLLVQTYALSYTTIHSYFLSLDKSKESAIIVLISNIIYFICAYLLVNKTGMLGMVLSFALQAFLVINLKKKEILKEGVKYE